VLHNCNKIRTLLTAQGIHMFFCVRCSFSEKTG
jgi:hypothetical protein